MKKSEICGEQICGEQAMKKAMLSITKIQVQKKTLGSGVLHLGVLWLGALVLVLGSSGCQDLQTQALAPTPTPVPTPVPDVFDPTEGVVKMSPLNLASDPAKKLPDAFRVVRVDSGELLALQAVKKVTSGTPPVERIIGGTTNVMRLGGIITPLPGQPGFAETVKKVQDWTFNQDVDVEQEPRFGQDFNANSRRVVQVYYTQRGGAQNGQKMLLNRMLVRLGYAVVDLNAPTSFPTKAWLNDEAFAREKKYGLWGLGITLAQRVPTSGPLAQAAQSLVPDPITSAAAGAAAAGAAGGGEGGAAMGSESLGSPSASPSSSPAASGAG